MIEEVLLQQKKRQAESAPATNGGGNPTTLPVPQTPAREASPPQPSKQLYSIFALNRDRNFTGKFNARGTAYDFKYMPHSASVSNHQLELTGTLSVQGKQLDNVKATLLATQGGVSGSPARRQLQTGTTGGINTSTPDQKQEQAKAPETQPKTSTTNEQTTRTPIIEATGRLGFVGALYFRLQPLDNKALGVPVDMSKVQLNVRLAPQNQTERDLLWLYSDLVAAVYGDTANEANASNFLQELNRTLRG